MIKRAIFLFPIVILVSVGILFIWRASLPAEIIAVHKDHGKFHILVKDFPITSRAKVDWWLKNKTLLQQQYGVPELSRDGVSSVVIWGFGDGYLKEEPDPDSWFPSRDTDYLRCFDDMKVEARCVKKENWQMYIDVMRNNRIDFTVSGGEYSMNSSGKIIKK